MKTIKAQNDDKWWKNGFKTKSGLDVVAFSFVIKSGREYTAVVGGRGLVPMQATCESWCEAMKVAAERTKTRSKR